MVLMEPRIGYLAGDQFKYPQPQNQLMLAVKETEPDKIELLKQKVWKYVGNKTICYSQVPPLPHFGQNGPLSMYDQAGHSKGSHQSGFSSAYPSPRPRSGPAAWAHHELEERQVCG